MKKARATLLLAACLCGCTAPTEPKEASTPNTEQPPVAAARQDTQPTQSDNQEDIDRYGAELPAAKDLYRVLKAEITRLENFRSTSDWAVISEQRKRIEAITQAANEISPFPKGHLYECFEAAHSLQMIWQVMTGHSTDTAQEAVARFDDDMGACQKQMSAPPEKTLNKKKPIGQGATLTR